MSNIIHHSITTVKGQHEIQGESKISMRWCCPLHADNDNSLSTIESQDTIFKCDNPVCKFRGDAVSLVALARGISIRDALALFSPGNELADCLYEPLKVEEINAYLDNANTQSIVKTFLARCSQALRLNPEKAKIKVGMSRTSLRGLHPDMGLFVNHDVPKCLAEFTKNKYKKSQLILYPYTKNGEVTKIDVVDMTNPLFRCTVVVTHPNIGVFGEDAVEHNKQLIVSELPEVTAALYATYALMSTRNPPIAAFQGYPLPETFKDITSLNIISTLDNPVSTEYLLRTITAPEIKIGKTPAIRVAQLQTRTASLSQVDLEQIQSGGHRGMHDVPYLLAKRFTSMVHDGNAQQVLNILDSEQVPMLARNIIKKAAENQLETRGGFNNSEQATRDLIELLSTTNCNLTNIIQLANGKVFHRSQNRIEAVQVSGKKDLLCNVGITVESKVVSYKNEELLVCTIVHSDDVPVITVKLAERDFTPDRLRVIIRKAYTEKGVSPYIAFYNVPGFAWYDILSKLAEHCTVTQEITELGIDSSSCINLPLIRIHPDGKVASQTNIFTINEKVLHMYSNISCNSDATIEPYTCLFEKCDNIFVAAFTLGLSHIIYQMTYGMFRPTVVKTGIPRHLFYVETEPSIWQHVFKLLASMFAGNEFVPMISYSKPDETLKEYSALGSLPIIAYIPTLGNKLISAVETSGMNLLGLIDTSTAVMTNGRIAATYVMPMNENTTDYAVLDGESIDQLRNAFIPFLVKFIKEAKIDASFRVTSTPCIATYKECCRILDIPEKLPPKLIMDYYPGIGMSGLDYFCDVLHRLIVDEAEPRICVVTSPPQDNKSFTRRGQHVFLLEDTVVISNVVFDIAQKFCKNRTVFNREEILEDMASANMLARFPVELEFLDKDRCWCMTRQAWEMRIVRPPINLNEPVNAEAIKLEIEG